MSTTISIALQKGGTGKTSTATALSSILGKRGKRVLLVDMDSQVNATFVSGVESITRTITDVFTGDANIQDAIYPCKYYDLLAGDEYLANLESMSNLTITLLREALEPVKNNYDIILIDTPPALGNLLKSSLMASDYVLIPMDAKPLSYKGLDALLPTIEAVQSVSSLKILGVVLVRYNERGILNRQLKTLITESMQEIGSSVFDTIIREGIAVPESQALQIPLIDYAPKSNPCLDYCQLADELISRIGGA